MNDDQIREGLIRIDHDYFGDFSDEDWDLWFGAAKEGFMEKFAVMLAIRQAALEEIAKEIGSGILIASLDEYAKKLKRVGEIARNATKGSSDASKTVSRIRN